MGLVHQHTNTGGVAGPIYVTRDFSGPNEGAFSGAATLRSFWNSDLHGTTTRPAPAAPAPYAFVVAETAGPADQDLSPASIVHTRAFGSHTVSPGNVTITSTSVVHTRAFGDAVVGQQLSTSSVVHIRAFGSHTVTPGNIDLSPASVVHARAFGALTVVRDATAEPASIVHTRAFGTATVTAGAVNVSPPSVIHTRAFGAVIVDNGGSPPITSDQLSYKIGRPERGFSEQPIIHK